MAVCSPGSPRVGVYAIVRSMRFRQRIFVLTSRGDTGPRFSAPKHTPMFGVDMGPRAFPVSGCTKDCHRRVVFSMGDINWKFPLSFAPQCQNKKGAARAPESLLFVRRANLVHCSRTLQRRPRGGAHRPGSTKLHALARIGCRYSYPRQMQDRVPILVRCSKS